MKLSQAHLGAGMVLESLANLDSVLKRKPDHKKSATKRVELLIQLGRYAEAVDGAKVLGARELQEKASKLAEDRRQLDLAKSASDWEGALRALEQLLEKGTPSEPLLLEKVDLAAKAGKHHEVIGDAAAILKRDGSSTRALLLRAMAFFHVGELEAAIQHLRQCINVAPDHAQCAAEIKRLRLFQEHRRVAQMHVSQQQWLAAMSSLQVALADVKAEPAYAGDLLASLCESFAKGGTSMDHWREGVKYCLQAAEQSATPESLREMRGNLHLKMGMFNEAIADFFGRLANAAQQYAHASADSGDTGSSETGGAIGLLQGAGCAARLVHSHH